MCGNRSEFFVCLRHLEILFNLDIIYLTRSTYLWPAKEVAAGNVSVAYVCLQGGRGSHDHYPWCAGPHHIGTIPWPWSHPSPRHGTSLCRPPFQSIWTWDLIVQGPGPSPLNMFKLVQLDLSVQGSTLPLLLDMFKLVTLETRTVGKRAVCIL